jgi:serpin B
VSRNRPDPPAVLPGVLNRRELLRAATASGLVVAVPSVLSGCSDGDSPPRDGGGGVHGGIELVSSDVGRAAADASAIGAGTDAVMALAGGLYGRLVGADNLALSPFSAAVALGMTVNGAAGRTREEMLQVLAAQDAAVLDDGLNALTAYVESLAGPVPHTKSDVIALDSANQVFGQAGYPWEKAFLDALASSYGAGLRAVDFEKAAEAARTAINGWTAEQTHDRIPEIIPEGAVDDMTRLVLVNALYFKASWLKPFEKDDTQDGDFHLASGQTAAVPMMHGKSGYGEGDGWRAAHLAYSGDSLAMTVVLPDEGREDDLDALVATGRLPDLLAASAGEVDLTLPRWKLLVGTTLNDALGALGMTSAFDPADADFSAMTDEESLFISAVLQQVFIAVDEDGTEAAAATAVVMEATSGMVDVPPPLVVDRPFVFVIHDTEHGTPLFLGKVTDPR